MNARIKQSAVATLLVLGLVVLAGCAAPTTQAPDPDEPDWEGLDVAGLTVNNAEYEYDEEAGAYQNASLLLPGEVVEGNADEPFTVRMQAASASYWTTESGKSRDEAGSLVEVTPRIYIAKNEDADSGIPVTCQASVPLPCEPIWFDDSHFNDGKYYIVSEVEGSEWRHVIPFVISNGVAPTFVDDETGYYEHDIDLGGYSSSYGRFTRGAQIVEERWWLEPEHKAFYEVMNAAIRSSGGRNAILDGGFTITVNDGRGMPEMFISRKANAATGDDVPRLFCDGRPDSGTRAPFTTRCETLHFVDENPPIDEHYLILTSRPGDVRQVVPLPVID